ncbi:hypothetical protein [Streptomyces tanashiensis]|uniref:hypothetical protein n=1 Tax=Streptomyces tanashiensis TaxID=67367 RepID=UPI0033E98FB8
MSSAVPYRVHDRPLTSPVTTFLWQSRGAGRVEATGECPECRCVTSRTWEDIQYGSKGPDERAFDNGEPKYARCACATRHVDRPAGVEKGCGASFWLAPPRGLPR